MSKASTETLSAAVICASFVSAISAFAAICAFDMPAAAMVKVSSLFTFDVVIVIPLPATTVNVSEDVSASNVVCPETAIFAKESVEPSALVTSAKLNCPLASVIKT